MFPELTELLLIVYLIESILTPKSKSKQLTPRTNSQTYWQREVSHVMNGIICCVCLTLAISVLQSVQKWCRKEHKKRIRWRKSHSKIEADDEFGLAMQRKDSWRATLYCIRKPGENQIWKSKKPLNSWTEQQPRNWRPAMDAGLLRMEYWLKVVAEIWWSAGSKNGDTCKWTARRFVHIAHGQIYCWKRWYGLQHRRKIRNVVKIQLFLAQGELSSAKDVGPIFKRCNTRQ